MANNVTNVAMKIAGVDSTGLPHKMLTDTDGNSLVKLVAGSALMGTVGIDQTTPGTTNAVALAQIAAATVATSNGVASTGCQRVTVASDNTPFPIKVDQTTPGTTNAVALAQIAAATVATSNGVASTGCQRVTVASDNTPFPVKVDQTTPGTTNAVAVSHIGSTAVASSNGVVSAGVQRVAVASDNTPFPIKLDQTTLGSTNGVSIVPPASQVQTYTTSADMSTAAAITPAPTAGQKILVDKVIVGMGSGAGEWFLQEETSATVFASGFLLANTSIELDFNSAKFKLAVADKKLFGKGPASNIRFTVWNRSEA